jgi:hypothetical protein
MSVTLDTEPQRESSPGTTAAPAPIESTRGGTQRLRDEVQRILAGAQSSLRSSERRREKRYPYPYPVYLTPVAKDGVTPLGETLVVLGKHLSEQGFDFYHREPLPYRRAIVSFETPRGHWIGVLLDLSWCRFGRHGWYDNGGRFLGLVRSPLA